MNRKAIIEVAIQAATDSEWGYESYAALEHLEDIDPDYDWDQELFQAELENGHRTMGPRQPPRPDPFAAVLRDIYLEAALERLKQPDPFSGASQERMTNGPM